jgi:hypothetical protein
MDAYGIIFFVFDFAIWTIMDPNGMVFYSTNCLIFLVETWLRMQCFSEDLQRDFKFPDMNETWFYTTYKSFMPFWGCTTDV